MRCGLFGKLPAKRDFVAVAAPRAFLRLVEPWLERGLAESRKLVAPEDWAALFASAPLWRFWLGEEMCHKPVLGVLAPSMDACGRLFPLTLFCVAEGQESISPPWLDPHGEWFERAEAFLAASGDHQASFEETSQALAALAAVHEPAAPRRADGDRSADEALREHVDHIVAERSAAGLASRTVWWSVAPVGADPVVRIEAEMPDPIAFTQMLTFRHVPRAEAAMGVAS